MQKTFVPWRNYVVIWLDLKATIVLLQRINSACFWYHRSQFSSVIWTQISWAVCHSGTDIHIQCSLGQFYVSSPWLPGAPHLPWANTNLLLCGFPFSPVRDPHHWGYSRCGGLFFFHLCSHVKPRFIHLLNPNVIFTMLVCESKGNGALLFFFIAFRVMSAQLGELETLLQHQHECPKHPKPAKWFISLFYWEGEGVRSKNNTTSVCSVTEWVRNLIRIFLAI